MFSGIVKGSIDWSLWKTRGLGKFGCNSTSGPAATTNNWPINTVRGLQGPDTLAIDQADWC